jgi:hypothetical protein
MYRAFKVMWLFLLIAPTALAQTAGGEVPAPAPAPVAPVLVDPLAVQKSTISGDEMLSQGREYRQQIQSITMQIQVQSAQAKADKDVIRLNCLLDKLNQVKVNANMMDQALQSLQDCVSRHDDSAQLHEYTRVTIINQKAQVLRTEADACVGAETNYVGPTKVVVESPAGLTASVDQPAAVAPPLTIIDRPTVGSAYNTAPQP